MPKKEKKINKKTRSNISRKIKFDKMQILQK